MGKFGQEVDLLIILKIQNMPGVLYFKAGWLPMQFMLF